MKYRVIIPVETFEIYEVEAESEEDAKEMVLNGEVEGEDTSDVPYQADVDSNNWTVEEVDVDRDVEEENRKDHKRGLYGDTLD